ncbi:MAG TPA: hypothetical protein VF796_11740, partial [Humisphaera sp.]
PAGGPPVAGRPSPAAPDARPIAERARLVRAEYGCDANRVDVTAAVQSLLDRGGPYTAIPADGVLLGSTPDPCPGKGKKLWLTSTVDGRTNQEQVLDPGWVTTLARLPGGGVPDPAAGQELKIVVARWGAAGKWKDVTDVVRAKVTDPHEPFKCSVAFLGSDPIFGRAKDLVVWYSFGGRQYTGVFHEDRTVRLSAPPGL